MDLAAEHAPFSDCCVDLEADAADEQVGELSIELKAPPQARIRDTTLEILRSRLQVPPEGPFDRTDIIWEGRTNQGRGRCRDTSRAIMEKVLCIPVLMLTTFVFRWCRAQIQDGSVMYNLGSLSQVWCLIFCVLEQISERIRSS